MFNLIKKDFIVSIKGEGKGNLKYLFIFLFMYFFINPQSYYITPIFISYLIVANTFYNDYRGNNMNFIGSMPVSKYDLVYSKYILALATIISITIICTILNMTLEPNFHRSVVLNDIYYSITIFLVIMAIVIPMYFKFVYHKVRMIAGGVSIIVAFLSLNILSSIADKVYYTNNPGEVEFASYLLNKIYENIDIVYINNSSITIASVIIFIISMYLSLKIIKIKVVGVR